MFCRRRFLSDNTQVFLSLPLRHFLRPVVFFFSFLFRVLSGFLSASSPDAIGSPCLTRALQHEKEEKPRPKARIFPFLSFGFSLFFYYVLASSASRGGVRARRRGAAAAPLHLSPFLLGALLAALAGYLLSALPRLRIPLPGPAIPGCSPPPRTKSLLSRYCAADTLEALRHPDALRERRHAELGDVYSSVFLGNEFVAVRGLQNVRLLLNAEHGAVEVAWPDAVRRLLGPRSVSTTYFDAHRALRRTMAPALGPRAVAAMVPRLAETVERHLGQWCEGGGGSAASQPGGGEGRGQGEPGRRRRPSPASTPASP